MTDFRAALVPLRERTSATSVEAQQEAQRWIPERDTGDVLLVAIRDLVSLYYGATCGIAQYASPPSRVLEMTGSLRVECRVVSPNNERVLCFGINWIDSDMDVAKLFRHFVLGLLGDTQAAAADFPERSKARVLAALFAVASGSRSAVFWKGDSGWAVKIDGDRVRFSEEADFPSPHPEQFSRWVSLGSLNGRAELERLGEALRGIAP